MRKIMMIFMILFAFIVSCSNDSTSNNSADSPVETKSFGETVNNKSVTSTLGAMPMPLTLQFSDEGRTMTSIVMLEGKEITDVYALLEDDEIVLRGGLYYSEKTFMDGINNYVGILVDDNNILTLVMAGTKDKIADAKSYQMGLLD